MRGARGAGSVCSKDCFHCPYPDCMLDTVDYDDILEQRRRDRILTQTPEKAKIAARKKAYYEANREEIAAYQKAYREANREEIAARNKAYYEANREKNRKTGLMIRSARKAAGYSQKDLGRLLGISQAAVSLMESGALPADPALAEILPLTKEGA